MGFSYENQGANTYLVYEIKEEDYVDTLSLGMLTNNTIPGLAQTLFTQMDETKFIKYNVSAKITLQQFFSGVVNRARLLGSFSSIVDGLISADDYMIVASSIILEPEYIFVDVSTSFATLICLPITNRQSKNPDLGAFFKDIMVNTHFDQSESADHVAKIFNFLNSLPVFSLSDFKKFLDDLKYQAAAVPSQPMVSRPQTKYSKQPFVQQSVPTVSAPSKEAPSQSPVPPPVVPSKVLPPKPPAPIQPPQPAVPMPGGNSFAVPPAQQQSQPQIAARGKPEKEMTLFRLLMSYSKDNKKLYEQQKAAKKAAATVSQQQPIPQPGRQPAASPSFAVPGMHQPSDSPGFAIPGQSTPSAQPVPISPKPPQPQPAVKQQPAGFQPATSPPATSQPVQKMHYSPPSPSQGQSMNFGETTVLGGGGIGETTVLSGGMQQKVAITPHLIRSKNNENIPLNKPIFRIGKERSYVDYFIGDNTAVSRSHANIISREDNYFVVDTNSTNHTYVNGVMIQSNTETEIHHGDKIRLANEDFEFRLY